MCGVLGTVTRNGAVKKVLVLLPGGIIWTNEGSLIFFKGLSLHLPDLPWHKSESFWRPRGRGSRDHVERDSALQQVHTFCGLNLCGLTVRFKLGHLLRARTTYL